MKNTFHSDSNVHTDLDKRVHSRAFTLLEMLIVIGIMALLMGVSLGSYSKFVKMATKAKAQELVANTVTALTYILQSESSWPVSLTQGASSGDGKLDQNVCVVFARRKLLGLSYQKDSSGNITLNGSDRFGLIDPWAMSIVRNSTGKSAGSSVPGGGTIGDHVLHYAIDLDGDGITEARVGTAMLKIRASAAVWSCGANGVVDDFSLGGRTDDIYSWQQNQVTK